MSIYEVYLTVINYDLASITWQVWAAIAIIAVKVMP